MEHAAKTLFADRVVFVNDHGEHVAFVTKVHSDHVADLVYYCPVTHQWREATSATFGKPSDIEDGRDYFVNPEA